MEPRRRPRRRARRRSHLRLADHRRGRRATSAPSRRRCGRAPSTRSIGQERVRDQLGLVLEAARRRGRAPDHVLLSRAARPRQDDAGDDHRHRDDGAAAADQRPGHQPRRRPRRDPLRRSTRARSSSSTRSTGCRGRPRRCSTSRWRTSGSTSSSARGPGATAIPLEIPPFTLVGATTRAGLLPGPLRDRFGFTAHLEFYEPDELERIVRRSAGLLGVEIDADGAAEIASRSRGTPRIANRLLRRVRDYAQVRADGVVTREVARAGARPLRGRRVGPRPARPGGARRAVPALRRRAGRPVDARRRGRRGARDGRGGRRAVPGPQRLPGPHAARPGRDAGPPGSTSG